MNKKNIHLKGKDISIKVDRNLFGKICVIAQKRELDMKEVLKYELGPTPWSLSTHDGMLRKTNKASLSQEIEKLGTPVEDLMPNSAYIFDGMNLVQKTKGDNKTLQDIAKSIFSRVLAEGQAYIRIDVVFDTYLELSVKNMRENTEMKLMPVYSKTLSLVTR